jgi:para-nitrobenzyl esterase
MNLLQNLYMYSKRSLYKERYGSRFLKFIGKTRKRVNAMKRLIYLCTAVLTLLGLTLVFTGSVIHAAPLDASIVQTNDGAIQGTVTSTGRQFLGIPYAAPPTGSLRWKAPQPVTPWTTTLQTTAFGSPCIQPASPLTGQTAVNGSENCLFLNVYTPPSGATNLPVMLWIHGGAFNTGAGSGYNPSIIVQNSNVIVVTINYRLGPLGFLALTGLSAEASNGSSGNYGILDQQAALGWVQTNIANFGGSASNVTIFGESAGGSSVCDQLVSPLAAGLFAKAITESGPCEGTAIPTPTLATNQKGGASFASSLNCTGSASAIVSCMRGLSATSIINEANSGTSALSVLNTTFSPNVDGAVIPQAPAAAIKAGKFNKVPVIEGTNRNEGTLFVLLAVFATGNAIPLNTFTYDAAISEIFGSNAAKVEREYPVSSKNTADTQLSAVLTDWGFSCAANTTDGLLSADTPTFSYEFADPNPPALPGITETPPDFTLGDNHGSELAYVFQGLLNGETISLTSAQLGLSNQMIAYWTNFAKTGNPNASGVPNWPQFSTSNNDFQSLTSAGSGPAAITTFSTEHLCSFWSGLGV